MKKTLLLLVVFMATRFTLQAQSDVDLLNAQKPMPSTSFEAAPPMQGQDYPTPAVNRNMPERMWDVHFRHRVADSATVVGPAPLYGVVWLDSMWLISNWSNNRVWLVDTFGGIKGHFFLKNISPTSSIRGFTRVGKDIWGCNNTDSLMKISLKDSAVVKKVKITGAGAIRWLAWDGSGFWCSNFSTDIWKVDSTGVLRQSIPNATVGIPSIAGGTYDSLSTRGPYLWLNSQSAAGSATIVRQFKLSPSFPTSEFRNVNEVLGVGNVSTAGGMTIAKLPTRTKPTLVSLPQGATGSLVGFELDFVPPTTPDLAIRSAELTTKMAHVPLPFTNPTQYNMDVANFGFGATPTGSTVAVDFYKNGTATSSVNVPVNIASFTNNIAKTPSVNLTGKGIYNAFFFTNAVGDVNPANDSLTGGYFMANDSTFGRDQMDIVSPTLVARYRPGGDNNMRPRRLGVTYDFPAAVTINSVTIQFRASKINDSFNIMVFRMRNGVPTDSLGSTPYYRTSPGNDTSFLSNGNRITLPLRSPLRVLATDTILIATNETDTSIWVASTPLLALPQNVWAQRATAVGVATTWGTDTSLLVPTVRRGFVIRPNINVRTATQEVKGNIAHLAIAPNPTSGDLRLRMQLSEADNLTIQVIDLAGRTVFVERLSDVKDVDKFLIINQLPRGLYAQRQIH
jgi:hypothetical protein